MQSLVINYVVAMHVHILIIYTLDFLGGGRPPLPILIFQMFLFFLRVWPPTLVHLEWGAPPGPLGGAPLGFVVMTWGVCPRPPLPILIFPVFLIFLRFMPPTLVNLEWGAPPGPLGGAPLALVLPLGASCGHAPLHPRTPNHTH